MKIKDIKIYMNSWFELKIMDLNEQEKEECRELIENFTTYSITTWNALVIRGYIIPIKSIEFFRVNPVIEEI